MCAKIPKPRRDQPERPTFGRRNLFSIELIDQDAVFCRLLQGQAGGKLVILGMEGHMIRTDGSGWNVEQPFHLDSTTLHAW